MTAMLILSLPSSGTIDKIESYKIDIFLQLKMVQCWQFHMAQSSVLGLSCIIFRSTFSHENTVSLKAVLSLLECVCAYTLKDWMITRCLRNLTGMKGPTKPHSPM